MAEDTRMDDVVTITSAEYEALAEAKEDLDDLLVLERHLANPEESVPHAFVKRMLDGESLLRLWREHRQLTQTALAERSGVNRVQIADIEAGRKTGSVATLKKLAEALGVTIDDLM